MKVATDIAHDMSAQIFAAVARIPEVGEKLAEIGWKEGLVRRPVYAIEAAGFRTDNEVSFNGEFDFRGGQATTGEHAPPTLRCDVTGLLLKSSGKWQVQSVVVESMRPV